MLFRVERWHEVSLIGWFALKLVAKKKYIFLSGSSCESLSVKKRKRQGSIFKG